MLSVKEINNPTAALAIGGFWVKPGMTAPMKRPSHENLICGIDRIKITLKTVFNKDRRLYIFNQELFF